MRAFCLVLGETAVQPILVDCAEIQEQGAARQLDDFCAAFQDPLSCFLHGNALGEL